MASADALSSRAAPVTETSRDDILVTETKSPPVLVVLKKCRRKSNLDGAYGEKKMTCAPSTTFSKKYCES